MYLATGPRRDPALLAVDDVAAVVPADGAAAHRGGVGARLRLGQGEGADFRAFGDLAHVLLLLLLGARLQDAVAEQRVVDRHDGGMRRVGGGDLDDRQRIGDRVHAGAAVFGRHLDAHQPAGAQQLDVFQRKFADPVEVLGAGGDLLLGNAPRHVLDH
jgi:hypothetical protein